MKFDCSKDDFSMFSTKFLDLVVKGYSQFNAAALDVITSVATAACTRNDMIVIDLCSI